MCKLKNSKLVFFLGLNIVLALIIILFFVPTYENNDDYFLSAISSGAIGQEYSQYLIFSNIIYGYILKVLNFLCGKINWYIVIQYIFDVIAISVIFYIMSQRISAYLTAILNMVFWYVCFFEQIRSIQFTRTAGLVALAGMVMIWYSHKHEKKILKILGCTLCVIGSWIRLECVLICFAFFFLLGCCLCVENKRFNKAACIKLIKDTGFVLLIVLSFAVIDKACYRLSPEWNGFQQYNRVRADLIDYGVPDWNQNKEKYEELGISQNDLNMLRTWCLEDPEKFSYEVLNEISSWKEPASINIKQCLIDFGNRISKYKIFYVWTIIVLLLLFLPNNFTCKVFAIINSICVLGLYMYFYYIGRVMPRVEYVVWIVATFSLLICYLHYFKIEWKTQSKYKMKFLLSFTCFFGIVWGFYFANNVWLTKLSYSEQPQKIFDELEKKEDDVFLLSTFDFRLEFACYEPYLALPDKHYSNYYYTGSWATSSPFNQAWFAERGIENPLADLIEKENYYYVKLTQSGVDMELQYLRENYNRNTSYKIIKESEGYTIYQFFAG